MSNHDKMMEELRQIVEGSGMAADVATFENKPIDVVVEDLRSSLTWEIEAWFPLIKDLVFSVNLTE